MTTFDKTLQSFATPDFKTEFSKALKSLAPGKLDLQSALKLGSVALTDDLSVMILNCKEHPSFLEIEAGIFFHSLIAGCNCADDPTPTDTLQEYCEMAIRIQRPGGEYSISIKS